MQITVQLTSEESSSTTITDASYQKLNSFKVNNASTERNEFRYHQFRMQSVIYITNSNPHALLKIISLFKLSKTRNMVSAATKAGTEADITKLNP